MRLGEFNALGADEARAVLDTCLGVRRWADEVVSARPYSDLADLLEQARASAENLDDDELTAALTRHPRIGEAPSAGTVESGMSAREQSGVGSTDTETAERLRKGNQLYEERFGRVFLIRALGRSGEEILSELERRLDNDDDTERRETVSELRQIALLRLGQAVTA